MKPGKDKIGIFVTAVCHDGQGNFLMGKRGGEARDHHGSWEFGGGTVEFGETTESALIREMTEEFEVAPFHIKHVHVRDFVSESSHWLGVFFVAQIDRAQVRIVQPVYDEIGWFTLETLPSPMLADDADFIPYYVSQF
jgi:ADP-ribose pyrophosphatase YjhB (NUDIX family)